jgi:hypothetical protein
MTAPLFLLNTEYGVTLAETGRQLGVSSSAIFKNIEKAGKEFVNIVNNVPYPYTKYPLSLHGLPPSLKPCQHLTPPFPCWKKKELTF